VLRARAEPRIPSIDIMRPVVDRKVREAVNRELMPKAEKRTITAEEMVTILKDVVGPDEGRERLASLLSLVRHEPKPVPTSMPPPQTYPMPDAPKPGTLKAGRPFAPPRPASVPKMSAAGGPPTTRRTASGPLPAVTAPPKLPTKTAQGIQPPPHAPSVRTAVGMPVPPPPQAASTPEDVEETTRESERMRLTTPLGAIAPGMSLKAALDEILTSVPSSIPPSVLSSRIPPAQKPAYPPSSPPPIAPGPETPRMFPVPVYPPLLNVTMPLGQPSPLVAGTPAGATLPAPPVAKEPVLPAAPTLVSDPPPIGVAIAEALQMAPLEPARPFDQTLREIERAEQATVTPPREAEEAPIERTLAMDLAPQPQQPPVGAPFVPPSSASSPPIATTGSHDALLPQPKPSSVGIIAFMIVITIAAGVAGTVLYIRHQRARALATQPTVVATPAAPATTSVAAPVVPPSASEAPPPAAASASTSVSAAASASAAPSPTASATPTAAASAIPVASATASSAPAGEVPAGMGVIHTTGTAPNRRIFVDEKVAGQTPESVTVKCGSRAVKLGSAGKVQSIDVPCGGEITATDK
jgi:serine/threonine-protein kinase